ncbi:caveolae-associated protein 1b [Engraulis encrasicolus]|uniref:caveolae-associated protein 1b n=1 Tax=Engraulis encrasicolus TaxID=184585 RepID=UPI002FD03BB8
MELIEDSNLQLGPPSVSVVFDEAPQTKSLTEISDDEVNLPPSDDEASLANAVAAADISKDSEKDVDEGKDAAGADGSVNGVMVLTLLDKIIGAVDQIQQTQAGLETRQQDMERSVSGIQGELTKLAKSHTTTANSVNKMLEKVRKVSVNVKTVRGSLEKQAGQIKRLESNEAELLKRRNFKVMIYQDEVKVPSKVTLGKSMKVAESVEGGLDVVAEVKGPLEEATAEDGGAGEKVHIDLSSDEEEVEIEETVEETRAEKIKRSSLQRVQNIKSVFSKEKMDKNKQKTKDSLEKTKQNMEKTRQKTKDNLEKTRMKTKESFDKTKQKTKESMEKTRLKTKENLEKTRLNIEKKMGKLSTRMSVNQERKVKMETSKNKLKKSFTPDHPIYARAVTAVYKVPPFTFHVKKIRDGEVEIHQQGTEMVEVSGEIEDHEHEHTLDGELEDGELAGDDVDVGEMLTEDSPEMMQALMEMAEDSELVLADHDLDRDSD